MNGTDKYVVFPPENNSMPFQCGEKVWFASLVYERPILVEIVDIGVDTDTPGNAYLVFKLNDTQGTFVDQDVTEDWLFRSKDMAWGMLIQHEQKKVDALRDEIMKIECKIADFRNQQAEI